MKKIMNVLNKGIANAAIKTASGNVNSLSGFFLSQPKLPKGYEKLLKHDK